MKLIIALGNPDPEYAQTRHNVGWMFLDWLVRKHKGEKFADNAKVSGQVARLDMDGVKCWLLKPQTYVNKSGDAVRKAKPWAKAKSSDVVLVHDDLDIPFGNCKLSFDKDSAGHKGVESVMKALKTKKFHRIRIGTAVRALDRARQQTEKRRDEFVREFVLHRFTPAQQDELKDVFKACEVRLTEALKRG